MSSIKRALILAATALGFVTASAITAASAIAGERLNHCEPFARR